MNQLKNEGKFYDDKRVEQSIFSFLTDQDDTKDYKYIKEKFAFKRSDISPFKDPKEKPKMSELLQNSDELNKAFEKMEQEQQADKKILKKMS